MEASGLRSATTPILLYVALLGLVPPLLVLPGLGAAGRPAAVLGLLLAAWWALECLLPSAEQDVPLPLRWSLAVYVLIFMATVVTAYDRGLPGVESRSLDRSILAIAGFAGVILVCITGLRSIRAIERVMTWAVGVVAVGVVVALLQFWFSLDLPSRIRIPGLVMNAEAGEIDVRGTPGFARVRGLARHPIEFGVVLGTMLPIAIHLATYTTTRVALRWAAVALIAAGIPLSVSRSGVLAFAIGIAVVAVGWSWRQRLIAFLVGLAGALVFMVVTPGLLGTLRSLFTNARTDNSVTGRTEDFAAVGQLIGDRTLFGRGPGTFVPSRYRFVDNEYLITVLQSGLLGLCALVLVLGTAGVTAVSLTRRAETEREESLARALGAAIAVALVVFATFDALSFPIYSGLLVLIIGCIGALDRVHRLRARDIDTGATHAGTGVTC